MAVVSYPLFRTHMQSLSRQHPTAQSTGPSMPPNSWRFVGSPTGLSARIFKRHCMNAFRALFIFTDVDNERTLARFPLAARNEKAGESDAVALSSCNSDSRDIPLVLALGRRKWLACFAAIARCLSVDRSGARARFWLIRCTGRRAVGARFVMMGLSWVWQVTHVTFLALRTGRRRGACMQMQKCGICILVLLPLLPMLLFAWCYTATR
jgi:hypothetical protein